jgi:hypothetical protein
MYLDIDTFQIISEESNVYLIDISDRVYLIFRFFLFPPISLSLGSLILLSFMPNEYRYLDMSCYVHYFAETLLGHFNYRGCSNEK